MKNIFELIYLIHVNNIKTQRVLAETMFISLGKANTLFKHAISEGFVSKD